MKVKNTKAARRASRESGAEHGNATQKTGPRKAVASMASGHTKVEDLYKSLVEDQTEVISRFLADGTFTYVNDVYCRFFGKRREALLGKSWQPQAVAEDVPGIIRELRRLSPKNRVVVIENRVIDGRGEPRWMQFVNRAFFDRRGRLVETQSVGRDITDRKLAEEALRESEARWKFASESIGDGVWDWDLRSGKVVFSRQWKRMIGYEEDEISDDFEEWRTRVHRDDLPAAEAAVKAYSEGRTPAYAAEFRMRCKDGTWKWIQARGLATSRDGAGRPLRIIGRHTDISARKAAKEREDANLRLVAEGAPSSAVLDAIVRSVEADHPGIRCAVMLAAPDGSRLETAAAPRLPAFFCKALGKLTTPPVRGTRRPALCTGGPVAAKDVQADARWAPLAKLAARAKVRACWTEPVTGRTGHVLGAIVCCHRETYVPSTAEIATVTAAARLAALTLEREADDKALRDGEARYRSMMESNLAGLIFWKLDGTIIEANDAFLKMVGFTPEDLREGRLDWRRLTPAEFRAIDKKATAELRARGHVTPFAKEYVRKDGSRVPVMVGGALSPHSRDAGVSFVLDMTDRKRAERAFQGAEAARQRESHFAQALVRHTAALILVTDPVGRIVHANPAFTKALGYQLDDILGQSAWKIGMMDEKEAALSRARFARLADGEDNPPVEVRLRTRTGETRIVEVWGTSSRDHEGRVERVIVTGIDVTEKSRLRNEVLRIAEQEQARIGSDLHDGVGQTMTGIATLLDALQDGLEGPQKALAIRIGELVRESVAEVRRMSHGLSPAGVRNRGLDGGLLLLAETVRTNLRTACICEIDPTVKITDLETETHLFRIAQEAVNNAMRHGRPRKIVVRLRRLSPRECVLEIEDNGAGFRKKKPGGQGHGIGVRVMDYRASLINGTLAVRPRPKGGVSVTCRFPCEETAVKNPGAP
ncbi:MAG: PAS domain S-box protein [Verrucomicrobiaceae bacterium]|nr:PAS domain S-box protein [Verrucomicrobiaceae bacterium]